MVIFRKLLVSWVFRSQHEFSKAAPKIPKGHHSHGPKWGNNQAFARVMAGIFNDGVEIAQIRVLAFSGAGAGGDFLGIYMWIHDGGVCGLIYGCLWCYNAEIYCINPIYCPIGSMYGIYIYEYANIGGILMGSMSPYMAYINPIYSWYIEGFTVSMNHLSDLSHTEEAQHLAKGCLGENWGCGSWEMISLTIFDGPMWVWINTY